MTNRDVDAQMFLAEFGAIASAPNGVQKLRQMVLQLAVKGKLVNHLPQDGDVSEELIRIYRLREAYEKRLGMRGARRTESESQQVVPYVIPSHWKWTQLGNVALYIQRGKGPKYADRGSVRVVSQKCVQWKSFDASVARWIDDGSVEDYTEERFLQPGDLLWNSTGTGTAGRIGIFPEEIKGRSVADSHVTIVRLAGVDSKFLWCHIASPGVQARIEPTHPQALVSGTTNQVELATGSVRALPVPLPPLAEQKRIVAKVDELMALCDRLEALQTQRKNLRAVLTKQLLGRMCQGDAADVQTCLKNLSLLVTDAGQVPEIRKAILSLAVQGKVVKQDAGDEPAIPDLNDIQSEKNALLQERKLRQNFVGEIHQTLSLRYKIPTAWAWFRLGDVAFFQEGPGIRNWQFRKNGIKLLNVQNIVDGKLVLNNTDRHVSTDEFTTNYQHFAAKDGDILFASSGATWGKIAWFEDPGYTVMLNTSIVRLKFYSRRCDDSFLFLFLQTKFFKQQMIVQLAGIQPNFGSTHLGRVYIPLPPLAEQKRIVAKVDEMIALCDSLEAKLRKASQVQELLAQTSIAMLTGIQTQEKEIMKAPKTELVARLKLGKKPTTKDQAPLAALLVRHNSELSPNALHQHSSLGIDEFYHQLKFEMTKGWIVQPETPTMRVEDRR